MVHPPEARRGNRRRALTRERVVTEALAVISADGVEALSMRTLAARLGVVPGALYRHVRSKEQLHDLILDGVLSEVDRLTHPSHGWTGQVMTLAQRARGLSWRTTPASPPCSRPAPQSAPHPSPWPRRSSPRCTPPACPAARPPWPSG